MFSPRSYLSAQPLPPPDEGAAEIPAEVGAELQRLQQHADAIRRRIAKITGELNRQILEAYRQQEYWDDAPPPPWFPRTSDHCRQSDDGVDDKCD